MELGMQELGAGLLALAAILTFLYKILMSNKTSDVRKVVSQEVENHLSKHVDTLNKLVENDNAKRLDINTIQSKQEHIDSELKRLYDEHNKLADNLYGKLDDINKNLMDLAKSERKHHEDNK